MRAFVILLLSYLPALSQVTKPVQVYSVSGQLQWPPSFFMTNVFGAGGTTLSFDSVGRMTITSASGSGTNNLIQTNGVDVGTIGTLNFTAGLTGYVSAGVVYIGNSVAGGGDVTTAQLLVVSNQMIAASNYSFTAIGVTSNKFQTDISNLQGATNGLAAQILVVSNQGAFASNYFQGVTTAITNQFRTDITSMSNLIILSSNKFQTDVSNLQGATNGLHTRVGNLEGATNGLDALVKTKQQGSTHLTNLANNPYVQYTNINAFQASNNTLTTWLGTGVLTNIVNNSTSFPAGQFGWVGISNNGDVRIRTISQGANITITDQGTNLSIAAAGGSGSPGGNSADIQFNETGTFAGTNQFNFVRATPSVELQGGINTAFFLGYSNGVAGFTNRFRTFDLTVATPSSPQYGLKLGNSLATSLGGWVAITNSFYPNISNHSDLGWSEFVWKSNWVNHLVANQSIRLGATNGGSGTIFSNNGIFRPTNIFVFNVTNPVAGQVFKFHSVSYGGASATIILTNDTDNTGGGGGSGLVTNANQFGPNPTLTLNTGLFVTNMTVYNFLTLSNSTAPEIPLTNHLVIGKDSYAGRGMIKSWDDNRLSIAYQPFLGNNRVHMILPGTTATTVAGYGMVTPVTLGAITVSQPAPTEEWPLMMQLATAATSNACAGVFSSADMTTMGTRYGLNGYFLATEFMSTNRLVTNLTAPAGNRLFIGRTSTASPNLTNIVNTTNATGQYAGLYADCGNSAQFFLSVRDGTAEFRTNTGMFWRATNLYQFYMMQAPTSKFLSWTLKDLTAGTSANGWFSNNVPTNMMKFGYLIRNGTTVVHSVRFNKVYVEAPLNP